MKLKNLTLAVLNLSWRGTFSGGYQILASAAVVITVILPLLFASSEDTMIVPTTRIQVACILAWLIPIMWGTIKATTLGGDQKRGSMDLFWNCAGLSPVIRFWATLLPVITASLMMTLGAGVVYVAARGWDTRSFMPALQFALLATIVQTGFFSLAMGLATLISASAAAILATGIAIYCLYGVQLLGLIREGANSLIVTGLWAYSPQLWLGDFTPRLVFNWGAMPLWDFIRIGVYCLLWAASLGWFGCFIFTKATGGARCR